MKLPTLTVLETVSADDLLRAIIELAREMKRNGDQPGAEHWINERTMRGILLAKIEQRWRQNTGHELPAIYHWSGEDLVCQAWVDWRKCGREKKLAILSRLGFPTVGYMDEDDTPEIEADNGQLSFLN